MVKGHQCDICRKFITYVSGELCSRCLREFREWKEKEKSK